MFGSKIASKGKIPLTAAFLLFILLMSFTYEQDKRLTLNFSLPRKTAAVNYHLNTIFCLKHFLMTKTFLLISRVEFISVSNFNCLRCKIKNKIEKQSKMTARLSSVKEYDKTQRFC